MDPTTTARLFAGVDVSKDRLDVCLRWSEPERHEKEEAFVVAYDDSGIDALRDLRAEFLSVYPARAFIFRGTRRMTSEMREGLR